MRSVAVACACLLTTACARDNPEFGLVGDATGGAGKGPTTSSDGADDPTALPDGDSDDDDDDDDGPTAPPDDDDDDAVDTGVTDASGEETDGRTCLPLDLGLPSFDDTFVVSDLSETCSAGSCEQSNFGVSPSRAVLDIGGTYRAYLLVRFEMPDGLVELASANLELHVTTDQGEFPPFSVEVVALENPDWGEGDGDEELATKGQASWVDSAAPTAWTDPDGPFPEALGEGLGGEDFPMTGGGEMVTIPLAASEAQAEITAEGFLNLAITVTQGQATPFWTREAFGDAIVLQLTGCVR